MSGFGQIQNADMRLAILQILDKDSGEQNDIYICMELARFGHAPGLQELRDEIAWLAEERCVRLASRANGMRVSITTKGSDAARGRIAVPGILRPDPI